MKPDSTGRRSKSRMHSDTKYTGSVSSVVRGLTHLDYETEKTVGLELAGAF